MKFYLIVFTIVICTQLQDIGSSPPPVPDASVQPGSVDPATVQDNNTDKYVNDGSTAPEESRLSNSDLIPVDVHKDSANIRPYIATPIYEEMKKLCAGVYENGAFEHM